MQQDSHIQCPHCEKHFDVNDSIRAKLRKEYKEHFDKLKKDEKELRPKIEKELRKTLEQDLKVKIEEENSEQFIIMQNELNSKSTELKEFNKAKSRISQLVREKDELSFKIEAELEEKMTQQLKNEKSRMRADIENNINMKIREKDSVITQLQESLKEAQIQAEQGSMQLQGEVQELAIEEWLKSSFPLDNIDEVKKGEFGADTVQTVNTRDSQNCGKIAYESKRTKHWSGDWISKFKSDILRSGANIGVLVTSVMPKDMERAGIKDGVWVCTFDEFKTVSKLLRSSIVDVDTAIGKEKNREEKMEIIYDYITGREFGDRIHSIVDIFKQMKNDLVKEKNAMMRHWAYRDKQLERVIENTSSINGGLKAIIGNQLDTISPLDELGSISILEH